MFLFTTPSNNFSIPIIELGTNKVLKSLSKLFKLSEIEELILKKPVYINSEECEEQKNMIVPPCI